MSEDIYYIKVESELHLMKIWMYFKEHGYELDSGETFEYLETNIYGSISKNYNNGWDIYIIITEKVVAWRCSPPTWSTRN